MVRQATAGRKARFHAALRLAGMNADQWAADEQYGGGVTRQHLRLVLDGERESPRLTEAVDRFIAEMAPRMVDAAA